MQLIFWGDEIDKTRTFLIFFPNYLVKMQIKLRQMLTKIKRGKNVLVAVELSMKVKDGVENKN